MRMSEVLAHDQTGQQQKFVKQCAIIEDTVCQHGTYVNTFTARAACLLL